MRMEDRCIFCGEELGLLKRKKLYCGGVPQITCGSCYQKYSGLTAVERARLAWETGRASSRDELRAYLDHMDAVEERKAQQEKDEMRKLATGQSCLRCGGEMMDYGTVTLKLGEETFFLSDLNRLMTGSLAVKVLRCGRCGKAEFYIPDEKSLRSVSTREENA